MLIPAISKKDELLEKFSQELYSDKYFWYCGYSHGHNLPEIKAEDNLYQFAIVNNYGEAVGFMTYRIDAYADNVYGFGLYSFGDGDVTVGMDALSELKRLIVSHHRVEWCVVGGNKAKKVYDRLCKNHGGRVIEFREQIKDANGKYHNYYVYEILKEVDKMQ